MKVHQAMVRIEGSGSRIAHAKSRIAHAKSRIAHSKSRIAHSKSQREIERVLCLGGAHGARNHRRIGLL
jgi:hypothetical protein